MGLKDNEILGLKIESSICTNYNGMLSQAHSSYDFSTSTNLYEVKSCHSLVKNGKETKPRSGRFSIHKDSHECLSILASNENKIPTYIFVILDQENNIVIQKEFSYQFIDDLLKKLKPIKRGDYQINYKLIFGDT